MKKFFLLLVFLLPVISGSTQTKENNPQSTPTTTPYHVDSKDIDKYIPGVIQRGQLMYEYDQAAWHGTDAFLALNPDYTGLTNYICKKEDSGWTVLFGRWNQDHSKFLIVYQASEINHTGKYTAKKYDLPKEAPDEVAAMERALVLAIANFKKENRPYNTIIIPAPEGNFYVYIYPGQETEEVEVLGGDARFLISKDGNTILESRRLHNDILEFKIPTNATDINSYHTHVLSDVPEDTDVFYVLNRRPRRGEIIKIPSDTSRTFFIQPDGNIILVDSKPH